MDFLDSIFSVVPLLMIILFIVKMIGGARKKNRTKPLNTIPPTDKPAAVETLTKKEAPSRTFAGYPPPKKDSLNMLRDSTPFSDRRDHSQKKESPRSRLNSLPELKKAVAWAEIIGKPKGLD